MLNALFVALLAFLIWGPYWYTNWRVSKLEEKMEDDKENEEIEKSLKPCQVCGNLPVEQLFYLCFDSKNKMHFTFYYNCPKCGTSSPQADTKKEAARRWNYKQDVMAEAMAKAEKRESEQDKEAEK